MPYGGGTMVRPFLLCLVATATFLIAHGRLAWCHVVTERPGVFGFFGLACGALSVLIPLYAIRFGSKFGSNRRGNEGQPPKSPACRRLSVCPVGVIRAMADVAA